MTVQTCALIKRLAQMKNERWGLNLNHKFCLGVKKRRCSASVSLPKTPAAGWEFYFWASHPSDALGIALGTVAHLKKSEKSLGQPPARRNFAHERDANPRVLRRHRCQHLFRLSLCRTRLWGEIALRDRGSCERWPPPPLLDSRGRADRVAWHLTPYANFVLEFIAVDPQN